MPKLEALEITCVGEFPPEEPTYLPSLTSLVMFGFYTLQFHTPILTTLHLTHDPDNGTMGWSASVLLNFLRNCPLLEVASLSGDMDPSSDEVVSLPLLRSFTHESPREEYQLSLLDRLSLPSTCQVVLGIDVTDYEYDPWIPGLPTPRDSSRLSDIRIVEIAAHSRSVGARGGPNVTLKIELMTPTHGSISFDRISYFPEPTYKFSRERFPEILESIKIDSVETLCFDRYPVPRKNAPGDATTFIAQVLWRSGNLKTLILGECHVTKSLRYLPPCTTVDTLVVSSWPFASAVYGEVEIGLQKFVESRRKAGLPLKTLTLVSSVAEPDPSVLEWTRYRVGLVEVVRGHDALNWDIDKYLLAATHGQEDNANRF